MNRNRTVFILFLAVMSAGVANVTVKSLLSDEDSKTGADLRSWVDFYTKVASSHDFRTQDRPDESLKLEVKPVQQYAHPSGLRGTHGAFYVWTREGRPEVVGSIWSYEADADHRTIVHEFDSLALSPLMQTRIAKGVWSQKRVIEPQLIPNAPPPGETVRSRATQIKDLAQRFEGYSMTNETEIKLRMLPRPLYQFQAQTAKSNDCALFCFFADWDPEIVLLIESRETKLGPRWHYSAARFNICPMWLDYEEKRVWNVEKEPNTALTFGDPEGPFFAVHDVASQPAKLKKSGLSPEEK